MLVGNFQSYVPQYGGGFAPMGGASPYQASPAFGAYGGGGMQTMNMLFNLMSSLAQLSRG